MSEKPSLETLEEELAEEQGQLDEMKADDKVSVQAVKEQENLIAAIVADIAELEEKVPSKAIKGANVGDKLTLHQCLQFQRKNTAALAKKEAKSKK